MRISLFFIMFFSFYLSVYAQQEQSLDTVQRVAIIGMDANGNLVSFLPKAPVLNQIAGAPKAFYSYFWEFGDGHYSTEKAPKHTYEKKGTYEATLWATNNYDTEKPPSTRPTKIAINSVTTEFEDTSSMEENFTLKRNREPMPNEDMVMVVSYKNQHHYATSGKIYLFYNENKYASDNFKLKDLRTYYDENIVTENNLIANHTTDNQTSLWTSLEANQNLSQVQDTTVRTDLALSIDEAKQYYNDWSTIEFHDMDPGAERNLFLTLRTPVEMLKDTSAIISIRGIYVPDNSYGNHKIKDMEMEIVTSHDPNKMSSNATFLNYRLVRFKRPKFKIRFQNNGEGPARTIRLETDIPEMFDKSTIRIEDMYPKCPICPKKEVTYSCLDTTYTKTQAIFTFKNIYLPGSEQKNVHEKDSTKGFVRYSLKFGKDFHKKKTKSRTAIIFDKNDPIITNYTTTRFLPGISIGIKSGYNYFPKLAASKSYFMGLTISPYKSYRWYLQGEFINSFNTYNNSTKVTDVIVDEAANQERHLVRTIFSTKNTTINWEVPILLRYNLNNFIGIGAGVQSNFNFNEKQETSTITETYETIAQDSFLMDTSINMEESTASFTSFKAGLVFDITGGFARIGPSIGARYILNFEEQFNYWQFYAIWKF